MSSFSAALRYGWCSALNVYRTGKALRYCIPLACKKHVFNIQKIICNYRYYCTGILVELGIYESDGEEDEEDKDMYLYHS